MKARVRSEARLVVWDPNDEYRYHGCSRITSLRELALAMMRAGAGRARLAYVSDNVADFPEVCRLVRAWAQPDRQNRAPCAFLVEELADVVPPGRAPVWWGRLLRGGRHRGIKVRAVGHFPREIDKTTLRAATLWHLHTFGTVADAEYMAREIIGCDVAPMLKIPAFSYVEYKRFDPTRIPLNGTTSPI